MSPRDAYLLADHPLGQPALVVAERVIRTQIEPLADAASILGAMADNLTRPRTRRRVAKAARLAERARDLIVEAFQS